MFPAWFRLQERLRIGDIEAGSFGGKPTVDRRYAKHILERGPQRERGRIKIAKESDLGERIAAKYLTNWPAFAFISIEQLLRRGAAHDAR